MNDALMQQFVTLISDNTGLYIREQDRETLQRKILTRMKLVKLSEPKKYYQLLEGVTNQNSTFNAVQSEYEWKELTLLLTIGESYFFRDRGQFKLLQNKILPELIERQRPMRSLRIWSAGCSTGEEPYSLAILIQQMIPDWEEWNILILGTDINQANIEKAKRGSYSSWSFRLVDPELQKQYFYQHKSDWELDLRTRQMVTFQYGNLVKDTFPNTLSAIHDMDLIICRNVFVYFSLEAIALVLNKFHKTLKLDGYLITGHAELHSQSLKNFKAQVFPESVVYKRVKNLPIETGVLNQPLNIFTQDSDSPRGGEQDSIVCPPAAFNHLLEQLPTVENLPAPAAPLTPVELPNYETIKALTPSIRATVPTNQTADLTAANSEQKTVQTMLSEAQTLFQKEAYPEAIQKAEQVITLQPAQFAAHYLMAQAYANVGQYDKANLSCQRAIELDSLSAEPYYLLAHIAEEQGDIEGAKILCKRVIYLQPSFIFAYLELASLYEREGDMPRAKKMRTAAVELIKEMCPDAIIEKQSQMKAGELLKFVQKTLRHSN